MTQPDFNYTRNNGKDADCRGVNIESSERHDKIDRQANPGKQESDSNQRRESMMLELPCEILKQYKNDQSLRSS